MVAVISKMQQTGQLVGKRLLKKTTGKLNHFGSGKKFKSTTGHVRPGMSLSEAAMARWKRHFSSVLSLVHTLVFG